MGSSTRALYQLAAEAASAHNLPLKSRYQAASFWENRSDPFSQNRRGAASPPQLPRSFVRRHRANLLALCKRENELARNEERNTTMNNRALKKLMMAFALCGALCGTAMAAPKGGAPAKGRAPAAMTTKAHAPTKHVAKAPAHGHVEPARPAHRHEVARHAPPPPRHPGPRHHHDHRCGHHGDNCCVLGATLLGGLVGGLLGAVL